MALGLARGLAATTSRRSRWRAQAFAEIARHLDPVAILPDGPVGDRNLIAALRPLLVDLLTSTGLDLDAARALLPAD